MTDDRSLQSLLNSFDWEVVLDLGGFDLTAAPDSTSIAFDQGGTATLTAPDGRYATVRSAQVSGIARSDTHNGLLVVVTNPLIGEVARRGFDFADWLGPVDIDRGTYELELHKVGRGWGCWAGGKPYGDVHTSEVCGAVLQYLKLHGTTTLVEAV